MCTDNTPHLHYHLSGDSRQRRHSLLLAAEWRRWTCSIPEVTSEQTWLTSRTNSPARRYLGSCIVTVHLRRWCGFKVVKEVWADFLTEKVGSGITNKSYSYNYNILWNSRQACFKPGISFCQINYFKIHGNARLWYYHDRMRLPLPLITIEITDGFSRTSLSTWRPREILRYERYQHHLS